MKLTVIGNSGSYPGPESCASCYLLEHEHAGRTWRVLLDMGNGALGALQRYGDAATIDGVFLSHLHADHCLDLCGYYVMRKYCPDGPLPRIPVWGPPGTARRMAKAYDLDENPGMNEEFEFRAYADQPISFGPFTVSVFEVVHPVPAYALRVEAGGRTFTYSGDTAWCEALIAAARDADVFLCEASFVESSDNPPDIHLTGAEAGRAATQAGVGRLLVTHIPPWHARDQVHSEAAGEYAGTVILPAPGDCYDI